MSNNNSLPPVATSFTETIVTNNSSPSTTTSVLSTAINSFSTSPNAVGAAWLISSAIFTTYSTTRFLKYEYTFDKTKEERLSHTELPIQKSNIMNKLLLLLPPANLLTMWRFLGSLLLGLIINSNYTAILQRIQDTINAVPNLALPAAFLFIANMSNSIALDRIGISLTYTSKCGIPLMTVLLTILLEGWESLPNIGALLSLIPIAIGIGAASWNTPTFELFGFIAAIISTTAQSALNVTSKRALNKTNLSGPAAQRTMVLVGLILTIIMNGVHIIRSSYLKDNINGIDDEDKAILLLGRGHPPIWLTLFACIAYHLEYVLSFMFVKLVQPITYGASDAVRRLCIILSGRQFFGGDPLTKINIIGITLALLGALSYSITSS